MMHMNTANVLQVSNLNDLMLEILSRLPAKSVGRFRCVSKLWGSMLSLPYFTELFLTGSSTRPRLLFVVKRYDEWLFFSSPQPQNSHGKSSLVLAADFHTKFSIEYVSGFQCEYASGLIYFPKKWIIPGKKKKDALAVICNPITGQYATLPELSTLGRYIELQSFIGFDPINKQFKVLLMEEIVNNETDVNILTLGTGKMSWRKIQCPLNHCPVPDGICINGVLYYLAMCGGADYYDMIVCFDVRTEKFKLVVAECLYHSLINYKGKLCGVKLTYDYDGRSPFQLHMWVLEDAEIPVWSKYVYYLWVENKFFKAGTCNLSVVGMTAATGEIVLSMDNEDKQFYVFYFSPERKTLLSVEIQVGGEDKKRFEGDIVCAYVDHAEDLNFNIYYVDNTVATSSSQREQSVNP